MTDISVITLVVGIIAAVAGVIAAIYGIKATKITSHNDRIDNLRLIRSCIKNNRADYAKKMHDEYHNGVLDNDKWDCNSYLESLNEWNIGICDLDRVKLEICDVKPELKANGPHDDLPDNSKTYPNNLRLYLNESMFDGDLYAISNIEKSDDLLKMTLYKSGYFSYMDTCEYSAFQNVLKIENRKDCQTIDLLDYLNRTVSIGVCTLTILINVGEYEKSYFLIHKRSSNLAEAANTISMVPAGTLSPYRVVDKEVSLIKANIIREFEEELLGTTEVETPDCYDPLKFDDSWSKFSFVGMGFDPLSTKLEMMTTLVINTKNSGFRSLINTVMDLHNKEKLPANFSSKTLSKFFNDNVSFEGKVELVEFNKEMLEKHMNNNHAMPVFRECLRLLKNNYDVFVKEMEGLK